MGTPLYYFILGVLLAVLVAVLVLLIRKRKREEENYRFYMEKMEKLRAEQKAEEEKKQPNWRFWNEENQYSTYNEAERNSTKWRHGRTYVDDNRHAPKYAAGDDMDRLKRERNTEETSYTPFILSAVALICAVAIFAISQTGTKLPTITQANPVEKLNVKIVSADPNQEYTKLYVTLHYENESINTCYNIVTTINLTVNDMIVNTEEHTIVTMPGGTETEEVVTIDIPNEYQYHASRVEIKTKYKWKTG